MKAPLVKFKGQTFVLIGDALTTKYDFENGVCSYAHVCQNGEIKRFSRVIGKQKELEAVGEIELTINIPEILNNFGNPDAGW